MLEDAEGQHDNADADEQHGEGEQPAESSVGGGGEVRANTTMQISILARESNLQGSVGHGSVGGRSVREGRRSERPSSLQSGGEGGRAMKETSEIQE